MNLFGLYDAIDIHQFDALYFYNPFEENVWWTDRPDDTVELSHERFADDVGRAEALLDAARVGTRVVTQHGFGGARPPSTAWSGANRTVPESLLCW